MSIAIKFQKKFEELNKKASFSSPEDLSIINLTKKGKNTISIGIDGKKQHHFLINLGKSANIIPDQNSKGIILTEHIMTNGDKYIDIYCDMSFNYLFNFFLESLIIELNKKIMEPNNTCLKVIEEWRSFFKKRKKRLSENKILGIIGELYILNNLLGRNLNSIDYWQGPDGGRFDFDNGFNAFEVKTTKKKDNTYEIHGEYQLSSPKEGHLYFIVLKCEKVANNGFSLEDLIKNVCSKLPNTVSFFEKLNNLGLSVGDFDFNTSQEYRLLEESEKVYLVDETFPKITPLNFINGVMPPLTTNIKYTITLNDEVLKILNDDEINIIYQSFSEGE